MPTLPDAGGSVDTAAQSGRSEWEGSDAPQAERRSLRVNGEVAIALWLPTAHERMANGRRRDGDDADHEERDQHRRLMTKGEVDGLRDENEQKDHRDRQCGSDASAACDLGMEAPLVGTAAFLQLAPAVHERRSASRPLMTSSSRLLPPHLPSIGASTNAGPGVAHETGAAVPPAGARAGRQG